MKEITLTEGKVAIVDDADWLLVAGYRWTLLPVPSRRKKNPGPPAYYAHACHNGRRIMMHRLILGLTSPEQEADHRDFDGLNNRRSNLRACTRMQNSHNRRGWASSGFKGVYSSYRRANPWVSQITCDGRRFWLGSFSTAETAARAYDQRSIELFGEFAVLNFPASAKAA